MSQLRDIQWDILADTIRAGRCVLFLGPGASVNAEQPTRSHDFLAQLAAENPEGIHDFHAGDGFLAFRNEEARIDSGVKLRRFYQQVQPTPLLGQLAQIPFHLVLMLNADHALPKAMQAQGLPFHHDYFNKAGSSEPEAPNAGQPLLYHLLENAEDSQSFILSHGDMYQYMGRFLGQKKVPQAIKTALNEKNADYFIFLGVDFDRWYFQLMLHFLGLDYVRYRRFAFIQEGWQSPMRTIWERHFRINFVPQGIGEFVARLHAQFRPDELRQPGSPALPQREYHMASFVRFFNKAFDGTGFDTFCLCYYEAVRDNFTPEQSKSARINLLMDHVQRHQDFETLLDLMRDENRAQYEQFAPYYA